MIARCCSKNTWIKVRAAVCPMVSHIIAGIFYSYSNTNSYIAKWLDRKPEDTIIVQQIWMVAMVVLVLATPKLSKKIDYWWLNLIAMIGMTLTHLAASFMREYYTFIILYSLFGGAFGGMCYIPAMYITWQYFPDKKSILTGCILFCIGISGMIFSAVSTAVVNPENLKATHPDYGLRIPWLFQLYTIIFGVGGITAGLLMPKPLNTPFKENAKVENKAEVHLAQESEGVLNPNSDSPVLNQDPAQKPVPVTHLEVPKKLPCPNLKTALKVKEFYFLVIVGFFGALYPLFLNSNWKILYTVKMPWISDRDLSIILSVGSASSSLMRIAVGFILLKVHLKIVMAVQMACAVFGAFAINGLLTNYGAGIAFILLALGGVGSQNTLMPMACTQIFGDKVGKDVYPVMFCMFGMANFGQYAIFRLASDGKEFATMFYILGALSIVSLVVGLCINMDPAWPAETKQEKEPSKAIENVKKVEQEDLKERDVLPDTERTSFGKPEIVPLER